MNRLKQIALRELLPDGSYTADQKADDYKWLLNEWLKRDFASFTVFTNTVTEPLSMLSFMIHHKGSNISSRIMKLSNYDSSSQFILELEEIIEIVNEEINDY